MVRLHGRGAHYVRSGKTDPVRFGAEPDRSKGTYVYGESAGSARPPSEGRLTGRVICLRNGKPDGYKYTSGGMYIPRKRKKRRGR